MENQAYEYEYEFYDPFNEVNNSFNPAPPSEPHPSAVQTQLPLAGQEIVINEFPQSSFTPILPTIPPPPPCPPPPDIISPPPPSGHSNNVVDYVTEPELTAENEQAKYLRILKEKEEHDRLIVAENAKRKLIKPATSFVKSKKIKGFEVDAENEEDGSRDIPIENSNDSLISASAVSFNRSSSTNSSTAQSDLSPELVSLIKKTAAWIVDNPDKAQLLIEKSRNTDKLFFIFDRHCPAGTMYIQELSRYKAEKEVHDIFHGSVSTTVRSSEIGVPLLVIFY